MMVCYAERNKIIEPTEGNSGMKPFCVTTSDGFSCWSDKMTLLKCSTCGEMKPENEFSRDRHARKQSPRCRQALYGRTYDCLDCIKKKRKELHRRNPQIAIRRNKKRRKEYKNPEIRKKQVDARYRSRYGITYGQYEEMLKSQEGVCAICGKDNKHKTQRRLHVDHDHKTGKVRELLCIRCNTVIGNCKENIEILKKMIKYLVRHLDIK